MKPDPTPLFCSASELSGESEPPLPPPLSPFPPPPPPLPPRGVPGCGSGMPKKRRKNSDISPSSMPGGSARELLLSLVTRVVVRMLTTAGPTLSTRSVKSGRLAAGIADAEWGTSGRQTATTAAARNLRTERFVIGRETEELLGSLVFYGRRKLLQGCLRNFAKQRDPVVAVPLDQDMCRPAAARPFFA